MTRPLSKILPLFSEFVAYKKDDLTARNGNMTPGNKRTVKLDRVNKKKHELKSEMGVCGKSGCLKKERKRKAEKILPICNFVFLSEIACQPTSLHRKVPKSVARTVFWMQRNVKETKKVI